MNITISVSKKISYWVLLMFFSNLAVAAINPIAISSGTPSLFSQLSAPQLEHPVAASTSMDRWQTSEIPDAGAQTADISPADNSEHRAAQCDWATGHCQAAAIPPENYDRSSNSPQRARNDLQPSTSTAPVFVLFRPPIYAKLGFLRRSFGLLPLA